MSRRPQSCKSRLIDNLMGLPNDWSLCICVPEFFISDFLLIRCASCFLTA
uniref:Uncharacterized protein n=1 Tax=Arundo donax TaxID=35708 RepID=A0A0A9AST5_ARUDO